MNPACDICQFLDKKPLQNQILTTNHWTVGVLPDQPYLGRAIITLLSHKGRLGLLSQEQWREFEEIIRKLEPAYEKAFGAKPLNIGSFMNHAYRADPSHPHVHWHIFPRYKKPVELGGIIFKDELFGNFYDDSRHFPVGEEVVNEIAVRLRKAIIH